MLPDRHRSVRDRHRGAERGNPPLGRRHAWRSPVLQARHHRLELCAGRRRAGRSSEASTSIASASSKTASAPAAPPISAKIISCRSIRWRQTRSKSSADPATLRYGSTSIGGVVSATNNRIPDALPSCAAAPFQTYGLPVEGAARERAISWLRHGRDPHGRQFRRSRRRRRHPARCRRRQFRCSCRRLWPQGRRLQHSELSLSVRPDPAVQRPAAEFGGAGGRCIDRRLLYLPRRLHWRCDHAEQYAVSHSRESTAPITRRRIDAHQTKFTAKGEYRPDCGGDRRHPVLGRRHRLQAQRNRPRRSDRSDHGRRAADLYQQGAGRPRRGAVDAVQRALRRRHDGASACRPDIRN